MVPSPAVCVTGASGFIAAHIIRQLLERGYAVHGTARRPDSESVRFLREFPDADVRLLLFAADLSRPHSFDEAVEGCRTVMHTASPYVLHVSDPQRDLVNPAVDGTLNVLRSCQRAGTVRRVVLTSSIAAITDEPDGGIVLTEADWNIKSTLQRNPYYFSKTLAERAAWRFMEQERPTFDLVVINPFLVIGPSLSSSLNTSVKATVADIVTGKYPGILDLSWGAVDVRDVALAHILAMEKPASHGRYLCAGEVISMREAVSIMRDAGYGGAPYQLPSAYLDGGWGTALVKLASFTRPSGIGSYLRSHVGRRLRYDNSKIRRELGLDFRPAEASFRDTLTDLERWGHIPARKVPQV